MVLMGGFASAKFPPQLADDMGFFPFPNVVATMPMYEDAPLDVLVLPKTGKNANAAHRFLVFLARSGVLNTYNARANQLSPLKSFQASAQNAGEVAALHSAKAITFYFDRDAKPQLVEPAFMAFKQFMTAPFDVDQAVTALDRAGSAGSPGGR
jgi:multiple sugar transport system substrate-binding protein